MQSIPEKPSQNDAFTFRLELLKQELGYIDSSIKKIDDTSNSIKNWAILAWTGAISIMLGNSALYRYLLFSAVPPLLFMIIDVYWRGIQRCFIYRQGLISDFLNSPELDEAFSTRTLSFKIFDPISQKYGNKKDRRQFSSARQLIRFPTISYLYLGLSGLSIALTIMLLISPPG